MPGENEKSVAQLFGDIPMQHLIGAPLKAVSDSQIQLADSSLEFFSRIGFDEEGNTRLIRFNLQRPVLQDGKAVSTNTVTVEAPFLGLVPIPALLVEDVSIDFQMEVSAAEETKSKVETKAELSAEYSSPFSPVSVQFKGSVGASRENTRSTNQTAKYQFHVNARQQPPTEGLSKLMDILAKCTEPIDAPGGEQPAPEAEE